MSRLMLSPNHCSCTVNRARNLPDKGKNGGPDAFCIIAMGKEKFATAICEKTSSPDWHEQCDMPVVDDATIKLTVYHNTKTSLSKGDFIGRALVSIRDLPDYDHVQTKWYPLTNKDGKADKDRGEIEVSLQFYSKNNTTGSVFDLATKKKHLSLKDIKNSLGDKLKTATKHRKQEKYNGENELANQRRRLDDGSSHHGRDFLDDSVSETTSFTGSHMSLSSMSFNNNNNNVEQPKKKSRAPIIGTGTTLGSVTPYSSRRSVTSDYETSSILDSASMYGGDDTSTPSPTDRFRSQQREVFADDSFVSKNTAEKKQPSSITVPTIVTTKPSSDSPILTDDHGRNCAVSGDDIEAAFDSIKDYKTSISQSKDEEISDSFFGLSAIKESFDTEENNFNSKERADEEISFDNYFDKIKKPIEEKKPKRTAPIFQQSKTTQRSQEEKHSTLALSDDIHTPSTSISIKVDNTSTPSSSLPTKQQSEDKHDSTDDDIDEIIGKLERVSSMRSSVRRKIQPTNDIMQSSFFEPDNKSSNPFNQTPLNQKKNTTLPDILVEQPVKTSKTPGTNSLRVLGYENVKSAPINSKIRQELDYLDREELLHVIAYQTDLLKKRDSRVKDLEQYTDGLLVKIVEQCPTILQNGNMKVNYK